ncbi:hypothetical protein H6F95_29230 [Cyanobacteria bacterium FACHB-471]|nr:hypothetical protein [Cyanobacteria bacterium FACHB-471]
MNSGSEDPKPASGAENAVSNKNSETVRKPIPSKPPDAPDESDKPRSSPGAQDRDATIPTSSPEEVEVEVVRRPVIPIPREPAESDDSRSPGVQDRDAIAPSTPLSADTEETEVVRRPVVPNSQVESEDETSE